MDTCVRMKIILSYIIMIVPSEQELIFNLKLYG